MHILGKVLLMAFFFVLASCQSTRRSGARSGGRNRSAASSDVGQGRTLGLIGPLIGGFGGARPIASAIGLDPIILGPAGGGALQSDPIYGGGYPGYGGYGGYGGYPVYGGYPGLFSGYSPFAYRPRPYYPLYGGYNPYGGYQRPSYGSYGGTYGGVNSQNASPGSSVNTGGLESLLGGSTGGGSTATQAQIANQLGQALGASLRPLLSGGGAGGAGGANGLASILGLLG